jgi:hypothetical protein
MKPIVVLIYIELHINILLNTNIYANVMNSVSKFATFSLFAVVLAISPLFISIAMTITIQPDATINF